MYDLLAGFELGASNLDVGGDVVFHVRSLGAVLLDGRFGGAEAKFQVAVVTYTGSVVAELPDGEVVVLRGGREAVLRVPEAAYGGYLGQATTLRVTAKVRNMVGMLLYAHTNKFDLVLPQPVVVSHDASHVVVRVHNPLAIPLTRGRLGYSTPAADHERKVDTIPPGSTLTLSLSGMWCNREHAMKKVVVAFTAAELGGTMHGEADIRC
eukprot:Sspe_Gene.8283::Locus_2824_Transcript_1_1_Confidence_1.000_Length_2212::g.8283::m.8283